MKCPMRACSSVSSKPFPGRISSGSFGSEPGNGQLGAGPKVQRSLSPFEDLSSLGFLKFVFSNRLKFSSRVFILVQGSEFRSELDKFVRRVLRISTHDRKARNGKNVSY